MYTKNWISKQNNSKETDLSKSAQGNLHDSSKEKTHLWNTVFLSGQMATELRWLHFSQHCSAYSSFPNLYLHKQKFCSEKD